MILRAPSDSQPARTLKVPAAVQLRASHTRTSVSTLATQQAHLTSSCFDAPDLHACVHGCVSTTMTCTCVHVNVLHVPDPGLHRTVQHAQKKGPTALSPVSPPTPPPTPIGVSRQRACEAAVPLRVLRQVLFNLAPFVADLMSPRLSEVGVPRDGVVAAMQRCLSDLQRARRR